MPDVPTLTTLTTGYACITALNLTFDEIETYFAELLNTVEGGTMSADIDMDGNRILNLGAPVDGTDAVRLQDLTGEEAIELASTGGAHGQCRLRRTSTTVVTLQRWKGLGGLIVDGVFEEVPVAGVAGTINNCYLDGVAAQTLSNDTTYYVYAFMNAGVMTLDFSTTGYSSDDGVMTKTGATTHTLVGMVRPNVVGAFEDTANRRFVRSYFNEPSIAGWRKATGPTVVNTGTWTSWGASYTKVEFLTWDDECILMHGANSPNSGTLTAGFSYQLGLLLDSTDADPTSCRKGATSMGLTSGSVSFSLTADYYLTSTSVSEGYHYLDLVYYFTGPADATPGVGSVQYSLAGAALP